MSYLPQREYDAGTAHQTFATAAATFHGRGQIHGIFSFRGKRILVEQGNALDMQNPETKQH